MKNEKRLKNNEGFTLIEILVVFFIIAILTVLGIAAYNSYNSSQTVQSAASDVATMLNTAKSRSLTQVIPSSCGSNSVTGYQVDITLNTQQYTLSAICGSKQVITTNNLPPNVTFANSSTPTVFFNIATGTITSTATILITGFGKTKTVTVSQTGDVSIN
jgi:prepilin-type N-terminal cleavage/methylation domain-containing protein